MAAVSAADRAHATLSTTVADTVTLTNPQSEVIVTNHHATVPLYVTLATARTAAGVPTPTTAVSAAAATFSIPPTRSRRVYRSQRRNYVKLSVVGNANPYSVEGNNTDLGDDT